MFEEELMNLRHFVAQCTGMVVGPWGEVYWYFEKSRVSMTHAPAQHSGVCASGARVDDLCGPA
jgi:hypothetical protein